MQRGNNKKIKLEAREQGRPSVTTRKEAVQQGSLSNFFAKRLNLKTILN
jgi:hypothetical protein